MILKNDTGTRLHCLGCRRAVSKGEEFIRARGGIYHPFCAMDDRAVQTCTSCFMIPCECME